MENSKEQMDNNTEEDNLLLSLEYRPGILEGTVGPGSLQEIEKEMQLQMEAAEDEEAERGFSIVGVHKDDFIFLLGGKESKRFASHGQQRSAIICLKAAQIQFYSRNYEKPIFILDDIFSELDEKRRRQSFALFQEAQQVFLTMPHYESLEKNIFRQPYSLLDVKEGRAEIIENA
jgi:DNA replication and repair protein RecF